ncbi:MAG TPA: SPOR domain-containing protein [Pyrinomonadaceae bacterium]|nr:SPOR domain-containing protein [Pyrinomonadaceae bacterium]
MEVSCPHCKSKTRPEVIEVADLSCTVCAVCKAVLGTLRMGDHAAEPLEADALMLVEDEGPAAAAFAPAETSLDDVLSLPEEHTEVLAAPVLENVLEVEPPAEPFAASAEVLEVANADVVEDSGQPSSQTPPPADLDAIVPPPAARPAPDGYAVGLRVLRIAPVWLLLSSVGFLSILLLLSWASQPVPQVTASAAQPAPVVQKNEASNTAPQPAPPARPAPQPAAPQAQPAAPAAAEPEKPQPAVAPAPAPVSKPAAAGNFVVQVGSYKDASEANARVSALRAAGFDAESAPAEIPGRGVWHRVYSGRSATREAAARVAAELRAKGAAAQVMVTELAR